MAANASNGTVACEPGWRDRDLMIHFEHDCAVPVVLQAVINWSARIGGVSVLLTFSATGMLIVWLGRAKKRQNDLSLCVAFAATGAHAVCLSLTDHLYAYDGLFAFYMVCIAIFVFGLVPSFFFSEIIQDTLSCLLALDPRAMKSVYSTVRDMCVFVWSGGAVCFFSIYACFYLQEEEDVYYAVTTFCMGLGLWSVATAFILFKTVLRMRRLPPSARAYLDEYPKQAKAMFKLQAICFGFGITILLSGLVALAVPLFLRRWTGMAITAFTGLSMPLGVIMGVFMFYEHWCLDPSHGSRLVKRKPSLTSILRLQEIVKLPRTISCFKTSQKMRSGSCSIRALLEDNPVGTPIPCAMNGLSIEFLEAFYEEFGVSEDEKTYEVCERIIMPSTKMHRCTFAELLAIGTQSCTTSLNTTNKIKRTWQGKHTVFVSHTWGKPFLHLLLTIKQFVQKHPLRKNDFFYLDIFGLNQHVLADEKNNSVALKIDSTPKAVATVGEASVVPVSDEPTIPIQSWALRSLNANIRSVTVMLVAIDKWDDPAPLRRIWCLYEVWQAVRYKIPLNMGFSKKEADRFCKAVESFAMSLDVAIPAMVDITKAQATVQSDLVMIRSAIDDAIGVDALNDILRQKLMAHLVRTHVQVSSDPSAGARKRRRQSLVAVW